MGNLKLASELIAKYMTEMRCYIYKDDWGFWDWDRYHTEYPYEHVKVIGDYYINILEFGEYFVDAFIFEDYKTKKWFKVKIKIELQEYLYNSNIRPWNKEQIPSFDEYLEIEIVLTEDVKDGELK